MAFHYINEDVKPLRQALAEANAELKAALEKLVSLRARLAVSRFDQCSLEGCHAFRLRIRMKF